MEILIVLPGLGNPHFLTWTKKSSLSNMDVWFVTVAKDDDPVTAAVKTPPPVPTAESTAEGGPTTVVDEAEGKGSVSDERELVTVSTGGAGGQQEGANNNGSEIPPNW